MCVWAMAGAQKKIKHFLLPRATAAASCAGQARDGLGRGERRAIQHLTLAMSTLTLQSSTIDWTARTKSGSRVTANWRSAATTRRAAACGRAEPPLR